MFLRTKFKAGFTFLLPLLIGLVISVFPYLGFSLDFLPGDLGDTRFNLFLLEHSSQFLFGHVDHLWDGGFMYPEAEVISLSDNLLGSAPFYFLFRLFGADIFTAFQYWFVLVAILNYWAAYKLTDYIVKNKWLAGLSGFVFAFSISLASQMIHAQTFPRFAIPLVVLGLLLWRKHLNWKYFAFSITMLVYQFYCGIYLGFLAVIPFLIIFIFIVFSNYKKIFESFKRRYNLIFYFFSIVINLVLLYKLFAPYIGRSEQSTPYSFGEIQHSLPGLKSYLSAPSGALIHSPFENFIGNNHPAYWNHLIFPGWLVIFCFLFSVFLLFKSWAKKNSSLSKEKYIVLITGLLTFIILLRIGSISLYSLVHELPGFSAMRSLTRIINVELLFFGLSMAIVTHYFIKKFQLPSIWVFFILLPLLTIDNFKAFENAKRVSKSKMEQRHYNLVDKIKGLPKGSVVSYEPEILDDPPHFYQLDAMLAAQSLRLKSVNGYSARAAPNFDRYWIKPNEKNRRFWFERFPKSDTISVVVIK